MYLEDSTGCDKRKKILPNDIAVEEQNERREKPEGALPFDCRQTFRVEKVHKTEGFALVQYKK